MGFVPVLNQVPTDPMVDLVDRRGECRHAGEDGRHHFDVSACRSFKTDFVPARPLLRRIGKFRTRLTRPLLQLR